MWGSVIFLTGFELRRSFSLDFKGKFKLIFVWIATVLISAIPLIIFMLWEWRHTGDPLYFVTIQKNWNRHFDLMAGLINHLPKYEMNHILLYLSLTAGFSFIKRPFLHWKLLAITTVLMAEIPLFIGGYSFSYSRFMSTNLGLWIFLTEWVVRWPWLQLPLLGWALLKMNTVIYDWVAFTYNIGP